MRDSEDGWRFVFACLQVYSRIFRLICRCNGINICLRFYYITFRRKIFLILYNDYRGETRQIIFYIFYSKLTMLRYNSVLSSTVWSLHSFQRKHRLKHFLPARNDAFTGINNRIYAYYHFPSFVSRNEINRSLNRCPTKVMNFLLSFHR